MPVASLTEGGAPGGRGAPAVFSAIVGAGRAEIGFVGEPEGGVAVRGFEAAGVGEGGAVEAIGGLPGTGGAPAAGGGVGGIGAAGGGVGGFALGGAAGGAEEGKVADGTDGGASDAFKVMRTVSFFSGMLEVCLEGAGFLFSSMVERFCVW